MARALAALLAIALCAGGARAEPALEPRVDSGEEVVFEWKTQRCEDDDIPDSPLQAYRRADGKVVGFATHYRNRRFFVSPEGAFTRDCAVVFEGKQNRDPSAYDDKVWIVSPWTADGKRIHALAHNEYQGNTHPGVCAPHQYLECWYNSIVLLSSRDGGRSFRRVPGASPIASASFRHDELQGAPRGFFNPTNLVERDGYFFTIIFTNGGGEQRRGNCLFRTRRVEDDASWHYWTAAGYTRSRQDAYAGGATAKTVPCEPLPGLQGRVWTLRRHRASGLFIATFAMQGPTMATGLIALSFSPDLMRWSPPRKLLDVPMIWSTKCDGGPRFGYPSLLDLASGDRNFADVGDSPYLYLTKAQVSQCGMTLERDLVRFRLRLGKQLG